MMLTCGIAVAAPLWDGTWDHTYEGDLVPTHSSYSAQGWKRVSRDNFTETYGVADGPYEVAVLDSSGAASDRLGYRNLDTFTWNSSIVEFRMRVDADAPFYSKGNLFQVYAGTRRFEIYFKKDSIANLAGADILSIDATTYHVYRVVVDTPVSSTADLYIDGSPTPAVAVRSAEVDPPGVQAVYWGDFSGGNGGKSYWDYISFATDVSLVGTLIGDANGDGVVDDRDLSLLLANWGQDATGDPDGGWGRGEFNGVAPVQDADLSLLLANWSGAGAVPEPASLLLFGGALAVLMNRHRPTGR